jgi:hypothetical protein
MFAFELLVGYRVLTLVPEDTLQRLSIKVTLSMQVDMDTLPFKGSFDYEYDHGKVRHSGFSG